MHNYLIRRRGIALFCAKFDVYGCDGKPVAYCYQKPFKLREDFRIYTDDSQTEEILNIQAREIIDFSATYDVFDSKTQQFLGSWRRKGWKSLARDYWEMLDCDANVVAVIKEDNMKMAMLRRLVCPFIASDYHLIQNEARVGSYCQHFNPFVLKLDVTVDEKCQIHSQMILAGGLLLAAIEGRAQ